MKWFRVYAEMQRDPKVQTLPAETFRAWVNMLCLACEGSPRGTLPSMEDLAFLLRYSESDLQSIVEQLTKKGLLETDASGRLRMHNWDQRQHASDTSTERTRKYRKRSKSDGAGTSQKRQRDVNVTPRVRAETDSEPETETEETPPVPLEGGRVGVNSASPPEQTASQLSIVSDDEPFIPPHVDKTPPIVGPGRDSDEAKALEKWAEKFNTDHKGDPYAYWARQKCDSVPAPWLKAILEEFVEGKSGVNRKPTNYLNGVVRRCLAVGACDLIEKHAGPPGRGFQRPAPKREEVFFTAPPNFNEFFYGKKANA